MSSPHPSQVGDEWDVTSLRLSSPGPSCAPTISMADSAMKRLDDIGYPEDASLVVIFSGIDSATGFLMKPLNFAALWRAIDHRVATFGGAA